MPSVFLGCSCFAVAERGFSPCTHSYVRHEDFLRSWQGQLVPVHNLAFRQRNSDSNTDPREPTKKKSLDKHGQVLKLTNSDQPTVRASELELRLLVVTVQRLSVVFKHYHSTPPQLSVTLVNFLIDKNTVSRVTHFHQKCPFCTIAVPLNIS